MGKILSGRILFRKIMSRMFNPRTGYIGQLNGFATKKGILDFDMI